MRIENDVKLDFKDVLIRPKRSVLSSRSEVSLDREFRFKHSGAVWKGVPIIAANMDHTGTFDMANALSGHGLLTAMDKFISISDWKRFSEKIIFNYRFQLILLIDRRLKEEHHKKTKNSLKIDFCKFSFFAC